MNITATYSCDNDEAVILIRKTLEMLNAAHAQEAHALHDMLKKHDISDDEYKYWSRKLSHLRIEHEMLAKPWNDMLCKIYALSMPIYTMETRE